MKISIKQLKDLILEEIEAFPPRGNKKARTSADDARVERRAITTAKRRSDRKIDKEAKNAKKASTVCKEQIEEITRHEIESSYEDSYFPPASSRNTDQLDTYRNKEARHEKLTKELKKFLSACSPKEFREALQSAKGSVEGGDLYGE